MWEPVGEERKGLEAVWGQSTPRLTLEMGQSVTRSKEKSRNGEWEAGVETLHERPEIYPR